MSTMKVRSLLIAGSIALVQSAGAQNYAREKRWADEIVPAADARLRKVKDIATVR